MTAPVPPVAGNDWKRWAQAVRAYLQRNLSVLSRRDADSVAVEPGALLWDAEIGQPVVADGTEFRQVLQWADAPASSGATGVAGQIAYDADYIYICTATDTWKRVGISTW